MLWREGYEASWTGVGPDGGRDIVFTEPLSGNLSCYNRKWLVSCKHNAHSGGAVSRDAVANIVDTCRSINAEGFILACTTHPSSSLMIRLNEIQENNNIITKVWDGVELEKKLTQPHCYPLLNIFLPNCKLNQKWTIYNTNSPSFWAANYRGYFFYMGSRKANTFPSLADIDVIINKLEEIPLPDSGNQWTHHMLRLRAVYYDDRNEQYRVYFDYIFPNENRDFLIFGNNSKFIQPDEFEKRLENGEGLYSDNLMSWDLTVWDAVYITDDQMSESFSPDAKKYYKPYIRDFELGLERDSNLIPY